MRLPKCSTLRGASDAPIAKARGDEPSRRVIRPAPRSTTSTTTYPSDWGPNFVKDLPIGRGYRHFLRCKRSDPRRSSNNPSGIAADGLSVATPANPAQAAARQRLDRLKSDPQWFQKLLAGEAETTAEYERLNRDLAS